MTFDGTNRHKSFHFSELSFSAFIVNWGCHRKVVQTKSYVRTSFCCKYLILSGPALAKSLQSNWFLVWLCFGTDWFLECMSCIQNWFALSVQRVSKRFTGDTTPRAECAVAPTLFSRQIKAQDHFHVRIEQRSSSSMSRPWMVVFAFPEEFADFPFEMEASK